MKDPIIETLERLHLALERTREEYENGFSLIALRLRKKTVLNAMSILRNFINNVGINVKFLSFNPLTKKIEFVYSSRNEILNCSNYCINISKNNIDALKKLDDAL
ncbi:hypothetical protein IKS57_01185 [bacterium]|nr:hypothetical protein [bacterium]